MGYIELYAPSKSDTESRYKKIKKTLVINSCSIRDRRVSWWIPNRSIRHLEIILKMLQYSKHEILWRSMTRSNVNIFLSRKRIDRRDEYEWWVLTISTDREGRRRWNVNSRISDRTADKKKAIITGHVGDNIRVCIIDMRAAGRFRQCSTRMPILIVNHDCVCRRTTSFQCPSDSQVNITRVYRKPTVHDWYAFGATVVEFDATGEITRFVVDRTHTLLFFLQPKPSDGV